MKAPKSLLFISILSLIGVGLAISLSQHYYDVRSGLEGFKSFCNISSEMNCDKVTASPYAEFAAGIPLSSFAAGGFAALFFVSLLGRNPFWRRDAVRALFMMASVASLFSAFYFLVMAFSLHTYCLFCLGIDLINVLLVIFSLSLKPESFSVHKPNSDHWKKMGGVALASLLVAVLGLKVFDNVSMASADITSQVDSVLATPALPVNVTDTDPSFGPVGAPVTIVEFSDFQCPYCKIGAMIMKSVGDRYPSQVRIVFRPFPLDNSCNRMIKQPMHLSACEAARVGICSAQQGKFEPVYESLFEHQTDILPGTAVKMATDVGASLDQLNGCINSPEVASELNKNIEEGIQLGVKSTPTFFVNGHLVEGAFPGPFWDKLVDKLLAQKK